MPVLRVDQQVGFQCFDVDRSITEEIIGWNGVDYLVRRCGRDPPQRLVKRADQRLHCDRIRGDELLFGVEHCRRIGAPEDFVIYPRKAAVGDNADGAVLLQTGDHRIEVGDCIDFPSLHRIDCRLPPPHADKRSIGRRQAGLAMR